VAAGAETCCCLQVPKYDRLFSFLTEEKYIMNCELKKFRVTHSWLRLMHRSAVIEAHHEDEAEAIAELSADDPAWEVTENDEWMTGSDETEVEEVSEGEEVEQFIRYEPEEDADAEEWGAKT
jgi:hypothetical protein